MGVAGGLIGADVHRDDADDAEGDRSSTDTGANR
jgi:hypothetical protein